MRPRSDLNPAIRFTLAPDGKSFAYAIAKPESGVWMLQGFAGKVSLVQPPRVAEEAFTNFLP